MKLPVLLFALAAFLIGSVLSDDRPVPSADSCTGSSTQYNTGCFCSGGCGTGARAWFSCYLNSGSAPVTDIGIRFEAGYAQPSQTRSWQISNQPGWPTGLAVDQYQPTATMGTNPTLPGPTPTHSGYTTQWQTSGVVQLSAANPVGPQMWACTYDTLLQRSANGGFGPVQPRCYSIATGQFSAPYSQGCQEAALFDAPSSAGLEYRGWGYAGLKAQTGGSYPSPDNPGSLTILPSTPLSATELRPLPTSAGNGVYNAGGINMRCFVSLFDPCEQLGCPSGSVCVGVGFSGSSVTACPPANCCPAASVIRPANGDPWYCCPAGQAFIQWSTFSRCCPTNESYGLDSAGNCCPTRKLVGGNGGTCCPDARFDPSSPGECCPTNVVGPNSQCCPNPGPYSPTQFPSNRNFLDVPSSCCPTANVNDETGSNMACCPASGRVYVNINMAGGGSVNQYCCPSGQRIVSTVARVEGQDVCCPATGGPFTYTEQQDTGSLSQCCPNSRLSTCTLANDDPICCPSSGGPFQCVGTAGQSDFRPCCPSNQVVNAPPAAGGAAAPRCCPNAATGISYVYFGPSQCCVATYVVDLTGKTGTAFNEPGGWTANSICCPGGTTATSNANPAPVFACSALNADASTCTWTQSSACCPPSRVRSVGTIESDRSNTICCPSDSSYFACTSVSSCPRSPSSGVPNPCCPTNGNIQVTCNSGPDAGQTFCCPSSNSPVCTSAAASGTSTATRRCCPTGNRPQQGSQTGVLADYCCPNSGSFVYVDSANPCCPLANVPTLPGQPSQRNWAVCCPGGNQVWVNGACCPANSVAQNPNNPNDWHCCTGVNSPVWVENMCCPASRNLDNVECCPSQSGRNQNPGNGDQCPGNVRPTSPPYNCWVTNANCEEINGPAECCCYAHELARAITNGPALPSTPICCDPNTGTSNYYVYISASQPCCLATRAVSLYRATPTSADTAFCCPSNPPVQPAGTNPATVVGGVTCSFYTPVNDANGNSVPCCRNCDINRTYNPQATATGTDARCCPGNSALIPTIVSTVDSSTSFNRYCCPRANVLSLSSTLYCCPQPTAIVTYTAFINGRCCEQNENVVNPNNNQPQCCPAYDGSTGVVPVWANLGGGLLSGTCCPPNQVLTFTGLPNPNPNVPASNASGAPNLNQMNVFCCPLNQLSGTLPPAPNSYIPAVDAVSGSSPVNLGSASYSNLRCCPAANVIKVLYQGKLYDVCCPAAGMIWNKDTRRCCPAGVITPPCPTPYPLDGCSGNCCPSGQTGAITVGSNGVPSETNTVCCVPNQITTWQTLSYCCPTSFGPNTGLSPAYRNDGQLMPCCPTGSTLECAIATCSITTPPYRMCCPASSFPVPAQLADNAPPPTLQIDPETGLCCLGYLNLPGINVTATPGGTKCCPGRPDVTQYYHASDDPCCVTMIVAEDNTCCPPAQFQPPNTCCPADAAWTPVDGKCCPLSLATGRQPDGTYTNCCDDPDYTNDPGQTCCLTTLLQNGYCCPPEALDSFGHCCVNGSAPHFEFIDTTNGVITVIDEDNNPTNLSQCCDSGLVDCAGFCYFLDPNDGLVKAYHVRGLNNSGCCPESELDCAGMCPDDNGLPRNNGTAGDCCPDTDRGCLNNIPNSGACGAADTNCCEEITTTNCTACIAAPGCGWCNLVGEATGLCLSGDYFGPNAGIEGRVCNQTGGYRWTAVGESKIFNEMNGFDDGYDIQFSNVSVLLAEGDEQPVTFKIRAPADLPLDLYILQDRTNSFIQPVVVGSTFIQYGALDVLKSNIDLLDARVNALVPSGYHLGFGTFGDKAVEPFGYWDNSGWFDYVFQNVFPISGDRAPVLAAIKALDPNTFAGGNDIPESSMEALLHVAQDLTTIGWDATRPDSQGREKPVNKIVVVVTDAPAHVATTNWPSGSTYAPGARFPAGATFPWTTGDPKDIGYYLSGDASVGSQGVAVEPSESWKANSGSYLDTACAPSDPTTATIRQPESSPDPARQGICTDYPSAAQVADATRITGFTSVFAVADTISTQYPLNAGFDFWDNYGTVDLPAAGATAGIAVHLRYDVPADEPGGLVYTIEDAIRNITQGIVFESLTNTTFMGPVRVEFNLAPGDIYEVTVHLEWDGSDMGSTGPFPIDFQAIFPLSGYKIGDARINVYISPEKRCCFCGDGQLQTEAGCDEECDNDGTTDGVCCKACKIDKGQVCENDNLCNPVVCNANGTCELTDIDAACFRDPLDPQAFCQRNSCLAGACVVLCSSDECCNDNDNCTDDRCLTALALCQYTLKDECDCANSRYNNCFDCVRNENTHCAYEANSGACFEFNETIYEQGGYGNGIEVVTDEEGIAEFCVVGRDRNGNVGVIVGSVVGALAALGLIALAAALWWRLRNGPLLAPGGTANTAGNAAVTNDNPTYTSVVKQDNPLHDANSQL